jgi:hypothetical protein
LTIIVARGTLASMPRRTALVVEVPEAEPQVAAIRREHDPSAALGAPAHITILFPFVPAGAVEESKIVEVVEPFAPFAFVLDRVERFPEGPVWLRPEPSEPFAALTRATVARWPEHPPYEGAHETVIPHLTVSVEPIDADFDLPIACVADAISLLEEDAKGRWSLRRRFALQGVA